MACGSRATKSCKAKSCKRNYNNATQPFTAGSTIQLQILGARVVDTGISIESEPMNYLTLKTGLYHLTGDVCVNLTTAGDITFQMYMDGVALPCTTKRISGIAGLNEIHTETDLCLTGCCCDVEHSFTFTIQSVGAAVGSVVHLCSGILKLA